MPRTLARLLGTILLQSTVGLAAVIYTFSGTPGSVIPGGIPPAGPQSFVAVARGFAGGLMVIPDETIQSCTRCTPDPWMYVRLGDARDPDSLGFGDADAAAYYYTFPRGSVQTPGVHSTFPNAINVGTLRVEVTDDLAVANAASFDYCGPVSFTLCPDAGIAPGSIASVFGSMNIAREPAVAAGTALPASLAGTSVLILDQAGTTWTAPLYFVSPTQVNFVVPQGAALGPATVTVATTNGPRQIATRVVPIRPGIFSANANGGPVPAAQVVRTRADGSQSVENAFQWNGSRQAWELRTIEPNNDALHLVLYGTGIRHGSKVEVHCWCGFVGNLLDEKIFPAAYAGPQAEYPGLDQVNVRLPADMGNRSSKYLWVTVDGRASNQFELTLTQ